MVLTSSNPIHTLHCVKRVRIRSYSGPHFSRIFRIRTEYGEIRCISPYSVQMRENAGKMRTTITPNTDSFYTVLFKITQRFTDLYFLKGV